LAIAVIAVAVATYVTLHVRHIRCRRARADLGCTADEDLAVPVSGTALRGREE
jgi:hypothetical protein